jgi:lysine biosynthesis protein LysW
MPAVEWRSGVPKGICPACSAGMQVFRDVAVGDLISCPVCGADLCVARAHPLELESVHRGGGVGDEEDPGEFRPKAG